MMKKRFVYCVFMFVVLLVQNTVIPVFFDGNAVPSAIFMLVLAWSLIDGFVAFLWWAIGLGLVTDFLTSAPIGSHVMAYALLTYVAGFMSRRISSGINGGGFMLIIILILSGTLIARALRGILIFLSGMSLDHFWNVFTYPEAILTEAIVNVIIFFMLLNMIRVLKKYFAID